MSPNLASSQNRLPPAPHFEEAGDSWAISYADFLMVLLCFFIFFFSVDKSTGQNEVAPTPFATLPAALKEALKKIGQFDVKIVGERAEISFPKDLYPLRGFDLNPDVTAELDTIIAVLRAHPNTYRIEVVGHADPTDIRNRDIILTNFDLSVLRASRALQYLIRSGVPEKTLSARGAGSNALGRRTLSLTIEAGE